MYLLAAFIAALFSSVSRAQHSLVVIRGNGVPGLVKAAIVSDGNELGEVANRDDTAIHPIPYSLGFNLAPAPSWASGVIDVSNLTVEFESGQEALVAHGTLKSDTTLSNCVIAIIAKSAATKLVPAHDSIKFYPLLPAGSQAMPANEPVNFSHRWDLGSQFNFSRSTWELHIFSNGLEVPTSSMKPEDIAAARSKTEAYLMSDHPVTLIYGRQPVYPENLRARNISGTVTLRCDVFLCGNALVQVISATNPDFGDAATIAVKQWLFTPAIKNHQRVEQTIEVPINFKAPNSLPTDKSAPPVSSGSAAPSPPSGGAIVHYPGEEMVDVGGHKLRILRGGQGSPTVVFESGIGGNIDNWDTVVLAVNQITSTLGYSRAGTEPSEPASGPRTPLIVAEELHTLLANARIKPPYVLVGHSLGAVYVRVFTLKYPGEVVGLVLVDGSTERQFVAAHALDPNSPISTAPTEMPAAMKAALSPNVRSEMEGMIATNISGVLEVPGCLPDIPMVVLTSLQSPAPGVPEVDFMMKLKRQLQQDIFQSTTYGMLIVTKKSPHNIMRTEPDLVINAIRFVVGAARAPAS